MKLLLALLLTPLLLCAQSLQLQIQDPASSPTQATVRLTSRAGKPQSLQTSPQGILTFQNLSPGAYRLQISKPGFLPQDIQVEIKSTSAKFLTITLALAPLTSQITVVATTPLPGINLDSNQIPTPLQTASQLDIQDSASANLADFMNRRLNGVQLNETQGNPFQPDINYRGFTASPLLGTPEGLSVYLDGVRQNQPFGDVVSWDLIPQDAIAEVSLVSGSNPVFGLNTLGGALSVITKNGLTAPGFQGQILYGSSGRKAVEAEWGGEWSHGFNWFVSGNAFHESGWRFDSPSDVRQGFANLGWRSAKTVLSLTTSFAYNTLNGNGIQDYRRLQASYSSVFTIPDVTRNRAPSLNLTAQHTFNNNLTFSGNLWYRWIRTETTNGNANNDAFAGPIYTLTAPDQSTLSAAGYQGFPTDGIDQSTYPSWSCIANALESNNPDQTCDAVTINSKTIQNDFGLSGQFTLLTKPFARQNQLTIGALFDHGTVNYTQTSQYGYILPDGAIQGVPAYQDSAVNLRGTTPNYSAYFTDTFTPAKAWNLTIAGRYNQATINNHDLLNPITGPGSLNGNYTYRRFNPSIGLTYSPFTALNLYTNYSQANRAPTSIELGCADANNPCSLPNALSSDPPLSQVITDTWEAGLRGKSETHHLNWDLGAFRSQNHNDILFVASQVTGTGYFQNFARTRRQGVQTSIDGHFKHVTFGLDYTFLTATYQTIETLDGTSNSTSNLALSGYPGIGGIITVHPGNRIPLIPKQTGKLYADFQITSKLALNIGLIANSSAYARGNENNAYKADGVYYLGPGVLPGYSVVNLAAHYDLTKHLQLAVQVDNLLDHHYYTAAQLVTTPLTDSGALSFQPFAPYTTGPQAGNYPLQSATYFAPAAPIRTWVQLRLRY